MNKDSQAHGSLHAWSVPRWIMKHVFVMGEFGDAPLFVWGDIPACISLFVQNVTSMVMIATFCKDPHICGIPAHIVNEKVIPGTALAIAIGNICFWYQGRKLVRTERRLDVCAQPLGINTPDVFSFIFNIMAVINMKNMNGMKAWQAGLLANFASAVVTLLTIPFGRQMLTHIPKPALFSALAGIAGTFLALGPLLRMYQGPMVSLVPTLILVLLLLAKTELPYGIPLVVVQWIVSIAFAWSVKGVTDGGYDLGTGEFFPTPYDEWKANDFGAFFPWFCFSDWVEGFKIGFDYVGIWLPLAVVSVAEILINISIASKLGRDTFDISYSLLINAVSCICGSLLGSPFPSVTFIGHPTFKALGGRTGYSLLQAVLILAMSFWGGFTFLLTFMPLQAFYPMVVLIGVDILSETYGSVSPQHLAAVSVGLLPALANFLWSIVENTVKSTLLFTGQTNTTLFTVSAVLDSAIQLRGIISLSQGFVLTGMLLSTSVYFLVERCYLHACVAMLILSFITAFGLVHSFDIDPSTGVVSSVFVWQCWCIHAKEEALSYLFMSILFLLMHFRSRTHSALDRSRSVREKQTSLYAPISEPVVDSALVPDLGPWKRSSKESIPKASGEPIGEQYYALDPAEEKPISDPPKRCNSAGYIVLTEDDERPMERISSVLKNRRSTQYINMLIERLMEFYSIDV